MKKQRLIFMRTALLFFAILGLTTIGWTQSSDTLTVFPKDSTDLNKDNWEQVIFDDIKPAQYEIIREDGQIIVHGTSDGEASSIGKPVTIDLKEYPIMEWRWKVTKLPKDGDAREKGGDDYGARIYLTFEFSDEQGSFWERSKYWTVKNLFGVDNLPFRSLNYIWANKVPKGEMIPNPFTDWVMMIPVESGEENLNTWRSYRRNIYNDYKEAFDEEPTAMNGVIFMTDADNSNGTSEAYWGEIRFLKSDQKKDGE